MKRFDVFCKIEEYIEKTFDLNEENGDLHRTDVKDHIELTKNQRETREKPMRSQLLAPFT